MDRKTKIVKGLIMYTGGETSIALECAVKAMQKQEPRAVIAANDNLYCPSCSTTLNAYAGASVEYCPACGQCLEWDKHWSNYYERGVHHETADEQENSCRPET